MRSLSILLVGFVLVVGAFRAEIAAAADPALQLLADARNATPAASAPSATGSAGEPFGVPFGISPDEFAARYRPAKCWEAANARARTAGDQSCILDAHTARAACGFVSSGQACYRDFYSSLNVFDILPEREIESGEPPAALGKFRMRLASFFEGRLGFTSWHLQGSLFPEVVRAARARYGEPAKAGATDSADAGGAPDKETTLAWNADGATLEITFTPSSLLAPGGSCIVTAMSDAYRAEMTKRRAATK